MFVSAINVFPVKGMAGGQADDALVEPWGLRGDRRWMVVDPAGRFVTQRSVPLMATIRAEVTPHGVALGLPRLGRIEVARPSPDAPRLAASIWRDTVPAALAHDAANAWVSAALGEPCRLVHLADPLTRPISPAYGRPGETTSFADAYPVLLTSLSSLADLNARLTHPIPIDRFRGNVVIDGAPPWAEDTWRRIRIGGATFRVAKPCDRCIVTTIDQSTGERPDRAEPLRTLAAFRHDERGLMFGQNLVPETLGTIAVGDPVEVLVAGPSNVMHVQP